MHKALAIMAISGAVVMLLVGALFLIAGINQLFIKDVVSALWETGIGCILIKLAFYSLSKISKH